VAINDLRTAWQPGLALEMAMAKCVTKPNQVEHSIQAVPGISPRHDSAEHAEPIVKNRESTPSYTAAPKVEKPVVVQQVADTTQSPSSSGELTVEVVRANWNAIRAEVKKLRRPQTEALLNSQKNLQVRNGTLYIGFDGDVLKQKMSLPENIQPTQQAIRQVLGMDVPIICEVTNGKAAKTIPGVDVDPDGLVGTALNLGGKLVHRK